MEKYRLIPNSQPKMYCAFEAEPTLIQKEMVKSSVTLRRLDLVEELISNQFCDMLFSPLKLHTV